MRCGFVRGRDAETGKRCSRPSCSNCCAPTGERSALPNGCSRMSGHKADLAQSRIPGLPQRCADRRHRQTSASALAAACLCHAPARSRNAICAPFRSCSVTPTWKPRRATCKSPTWPCAPRPVRSIRWISTSRSSMKQHRPEMADVFRTHHKRVPGSLEPVLSRQQRKALRDIRDCRTAALAATSSSAISADIASSYITRAAIGIAPSARPRRAPDGWRSGKPSFCRFPISTSYSHCRSRSAGWRCRTRNRFTPSCFAPPPATLLETAADPRLLGASHRLPRRAAHLGSEPASASAPALRRARRRNLPRRLALDRAAAKSSFFLPVRVLSHRFRKSFLRSLRQAFRKGALHFHGELRISGRTRRL